jgi:hypothetical protein
VKEKKVEKPRPVVVKALWSLAAELTACYQPFSELRTSRKHWRERKQTINSEQPYSA